MTLEPHAFGVAVALEPHAFDVTVALKPHAFSMVVLLVPHSVQESHIYTEVVLLAPTAGLELLESEF